MEKGKLLQEGTYPIKEQKKNLAGMIDHTLLKAEATEAQIIKLCQEAMEHKFCSVCVNSSYTELCAENLKGSSVKVCTVVGFPLGAQATKVKVKETKFAVRNGATEIDMVLNIGAVKSGNWEFVREEIEEVVSEAKGRAIVKVILETCLLTEEEKIKACNVSKLAGANFVKTSTGFSSGGATVEDIRLMRKVVGPEMGVKASGGVRDYQTAMAMIEAGATRIGTSSGIAILKGETASEGSKENDVY